MADITPPAPAEPQHWSEKFADEFVGVVDKIRGNTVDKITMIAKYAVYGLFATIAGIFVAISSAIILVRGLVIITGFDIFPGSGQQVWFAHLVIGGIFCLAGAFAWRKRPDVDF